MTGNRLLSLMTWHVRYVVYAFQPVQKKQLFENVHLPVIRHKHKNILWSFRDGHDEKNV